MIECQYPWLEPLFRAIDARDDAAFAGFLAEHCRFRFGNAPDVVGREAIQALVAGFFASLGGLAHQLEEVIGEGDRLVCHGQVSYTRRDGSALRVPFANVFRLEGGLIQDYLIFIDNSAL